MNAIRQTRLLTPACALAAIAFALWIAACTPQQESPLDFGDLATVKAASPTPTPLPGQPTATPIPAEQMAQVAQERSESYLDALYEPTDGTIRVGVWDEKRALFNSHLAAYVIVYGFDYTVEMVETTREEFPAMLESGELDLVMQTHPDQNDWLREQAAKGSVLDVGAFTAVADTRIAAHGRLLERAPQIVDFLAAVVPDDELFDGAAARISGGRLGINPNVAALIILKNHEELWTPWAPPEVVEKVKAAIASGKTDLKNRKCVPSGGGASTPNCRG